MAGSDSRRTGLWALLHVALLHVLATIALAGCSSPPQPAADVLVASSLAPDTSVPPAKALGWAVVDGPHRQDLGDREEMSKFEYRPHDMQSLVLRKVQLRASLGDLVGTTELRLTLQNPYSRTIEARFGLDLPDGARIVRLAQLDQDEWLEASVVRKDLGTAAFERNARVTGIDPTLVTVEAGNRALFRLFPVRSLAKVEIRLIVAQPLGQTWSWPMRGWPRLEELDLDVFSADDEDAPTQIHADHRKSAAPTRDLVVRRPGALLPAAATRDGFTLVRVVAEPATPTPTDGSALVLVDASVATGPRKWLWRRLAVDTVAQLARCGLQQVEVVAAGDQLRPVFRGRAKDFDLARADWSMQGAQQTTGWLDMVAARPGPLASRLIWLGGGGTAWGTGRPAAIRQALQRLSARGLARVDAVSLTAGTDRDALQALALADASTGVVVVAASSGDPTAPDPALQALCGAPARRVSVQFEGYTPLPTIQVAPGAAVYVARENSGETAPALQAAGQALLPMPGVESPASPALPQVAAAITAEQEPYQTLRLAENQQVLLPSVALWIGERVAHTADALRPRPVLGVERTGRVHRFLVKVGQTAEARLPRADDEFLRKSSEHMDSYYGLPPPNPIQTCVRRLLGPVGATSRAYAAMAPLAEALVDCGCFSRDDTWDPVPLRVDASGRPSLDPRPAPRPTTDLWGVEDDHCSDSLVHQGACIWRGEYRAQRACLTRCLANWNGNSRLVPTKAPWYIETVHLEYPRAHPDRRRVCRAAGLPSHSGEISAQTEVWESRYRERHQFDDKDPDGQRTDRPGNRTPRPKSLAGSWPFAVVGRAPPALDGDVRLLDDACTVAPGWPLPSAATATDAIPAVAQALAQWHQGDPGWLAFAIARCLEAAPEPGACAGGAATQLIESVKASPEQPWILGFAALQAGRWQEALAHLPAEIAGAAGEAVVAKKPDLAQAIDVALADKDSPDDRTSRWGQPFVAVCVAASERLGGRLSVDLVLSDSADPYFDKYVSLPSCVAYPLPVGRRAHATITFAIRPAFLDVAAYAVVARWDGRRLATRTVTLTRVWPDPLPDVPSWAGLPLTYDLGWW